MGRALLLTFLLVATAADAGNPRTLHLRFPRFTLPAGANSELCVLIRLPLRTPFDLGTWEIKHHTRTLAVRHFLVYLYQGEHLADLQQQARKVISSRACLDLGPVDRDRRSLVFNGTSIATRGNFPPGVALRLAPVPDAPGGTPAGIGILLDANWVNPSGHPASASTSITLHRARSRSVTRVATPILSDGAGLGLSVPPGGIRSTEDSTTALHAVRADVPAVDVWAPASDTCVLFVTGHEHERGRLFTVDKLGTDGSVQNPSAAFSDPFIPGRMHLFATVDYTDPRTLPFAPPLLVRTGEALHYACWQDNGVQQATRLGCEESPGVPPGIALGLPDGHAAKSCDVTGPASPDCPATDPAYPGRQFTGSCVAANLVAGTTPDDEVCALALLGYPSAGGDPATACDVSSAPPLP